MPDSFRMDRTGAFRTGLSNFGYARRYSIEGKPGNPWGGFYARFRGEIPPTRPATGPWPWTERPDQLSHCVLDRSRRRPRPAVGFPQRASGID